MGYVGEEVTVWTEGGRPARIVWRRCRFRVTDMPTSWGSFSQVDAIHPAITHPPRRAVTWRFQATSDQGESHVFDVCLDEAGGRWRLVRVWD